jgi:predicted 3-demethylubiquinone-9 3-methyltransferase (glyoxalase superfamily)
MQKITPFLWFDNQAEEAANHYIAIFKNSKINRVTHYGPGTPGPEGTVMTVDFELDGQEFTALNGGPQFSFTEAISFVANAESQEEVDEIWDKLVEGGQPGPCGWLKDKFGVSWQVVPTALTELLAASDPAGVQRVMDVMLQVQGKFDVAALRAAYAGD